jgi:hypothetical protein
LTGFVPARCELRSAWTEGCEEQDTWAQAADENKVAEISIASYEQPAPTLSLTQDVLVGGRTESHLGSTNYVMPERGEESHRDNVNVLI